MTDTTPPIDLEGRCRHCGEVGEGPCDCRKVPTPEARAALVAELLEKSENYQDHFCAAPMRLAAALLAADGERLAAIRRLAEKSTITAPRSERMDTWIRGYEQALADVQTILTRPEDPR